MIAKIRAAGAEDVIQHGESWVEADTYLKEALMVKARERGDKAVYVPPFDDPLIWNGNATIVREISRQLPGVNAPHALVCSVGGGGLFAGLMQGLDDVGLLYTSVLAVETEGAHSLAFSLDRGELSTLSAITSKATSLGARRVAEQAYKEAQRKTVKSIVLSDEEAMEGCVRFANDERFMVEMACGVSLAMCYEGRLKQEMPELESESIVVIVVCGGSNVSAEMLGEWAETIQ
jgi:L-serine/L-threonine ammonia-lyase